LAGGPPPAATVLNSVSRRIFRARKSRRCGGNWNGPAVLVGSPTSGRQSPAK
jgi:hypothetical protein